MRLTKSICLVLFIIGGHSLSVAEEFPHLTVEQSLTAARHNSKPGSSFTVLRKIIATAETRRVGVQALQEAQAHRIELYENGLLSNILRSGAYLLAEIDPRTNNLIATHLIVMESGGAVKDIEAKCAGSVKLADAQEVFKDTTEFVKQLYSTPATDVSSLANRFYGGHFPDADLFPDSLFTTPASWRKLGATPDEIGRAAALFWGHELWSVRYALAMPVFSVSPAAAGDAAEKERNRLMAEFLQSNKMDFNHDLVADLDNLHDGRQLKDRIELLTKLNRFMEDSLRREVDPIVVGANLALLMIPLSVDVDKTQAGQYVSSSPPKFLFLWHRVATGGFAVGEITWAW